MVILNLFKINNNIETTGNCSPQVLKENSKSLKRIKTKNTFVPRKGEYVTVYNILYKVKEVEYNYEWCELGTDETIAACNIFLKKVKH